MHSISAAAVIEKNYTAPQKNVPIIVVVGVIATGRLDIARGKDLYGVKSKSHEV